VIFVKIGTVQNMFFLRVLMKLSAYLLLFFCQMRIKFDARNIYKTVLRLCEFRKKKKKPLYSEIRSLLGGRKFFLSLFTKFFIRFGL